MNPFMDEAHRLATAGRVAWTAFELENERIGAMRIWDAHSWQAGYIAALKECSRSATEPTASVRERLDGGDQNPRSE